MEEKKRSYFYALEIIKFIDLLDKKGFISQTIARQLLRSAASVGANIVEAQAGSSKKDFTNYFSHSIKSANESLFWLNLLKDSQKVEAGPVEKLIQETKEISSILGASILTLRGKK